MVSGLNLKTGEESWLGLPDEAQFKAAELRLAGYRRVQVRESRPPSEFMVAAGHPPKH